MWRSPEPFSAIRRHCSTCSGSALEWPPDPFPARHCQVLSQLDTFAGRTHLISPLGQHGPAEELCRGAAIASVAYP